MLWEVGVEFRAPDHEVIDERILKCIAAIFEAWTEENGGRRLLEICLGNAAQ